MGRSGVHEEEEEASAAAHHLSPPLKRLKLEHDNEENGGGQGQGEGEGRSVLGLVEDPIAMARTLPEDEEEEEEGRGLALGVALDENSVLGPKGFIRRGEFTRVIAQALSTLGYPRAAELLEKESGVCVEPPSAVALRCHVLARDWDSALAALVAIAGLDPRSATEASFLILQEKLLEQLLSGDPLAALCTLRTQIRPLNICDAQVHALAACIVFPSQADSIRILNNKKGGGVGAQCGGPIRKPEVDLLAELQELLPPSVMIPQCRLEHLVEQALSVQRDACIFHNSPDTAMSLYTDHRCGRDRIPTHTVQVLDKHQNEVWFLQFSHNGKYLASASKDNCAFIWEITGDNFVRFKYTLASHQKPVSLVAWSPDDTMLLTCGNEEVVKLWDVATGQCKHTFNEPVPNFSACAWLPDGGVATGGPDKVIRLWNASGKEVYSWMMSVPGVSRISDITLTTDGKHLLSVCEKDICIYNLETKEERTITEDKAITSVSVSKDGDFLLINLLNEEVHLWSIDANTSSPKLISKYKGHLHGRYVIRSCFGGSDQTFIASGSEDSQVYIWHRASGDLLEVLPGHSGTVNCVSWNPVNPYMFASASDDHTIRIWGLGTNASQKNH